MLSKKSKRRPSVISLVTIIISVVLSLLYFISSAEPRSGGSDLGVAFILIISITGGDALSIISIISGIYGLKTEGWRLSVISLIINACWWVFILPPSILNKQNRLVYILTMALVSCFIISVFFLISQILKKIKSK